MGFKFSFLCDLLSSLDDNRILKATTASKASNPDTRVVARWFNQHEKRLHDKTTDPLAFLSCLFPEKRTDRVYWLQDASLARLIGRCLLLGSSRREQLDRWRLSGGVDLGQCVENVMRQAENHTPEDQEVTVEEIDCALNNIASRCRFSGPRVRKSHTAVDVEEALGPLYRRLSSRDAKWLTRMILKSYSPVAVPTVLALRSYHFLLPHLLLFQDSLEAALNTLALEPIRHFPPHPEPGLARDLGAIAVQHLSPVIGVKIGRPEFYKARSIKNCCQMVGHRRMSLERKYDGEYCQIHIDHTGPSSSIQIFSKSGKDSTVDRAGIHQIIRESLRVGERDCRFSRRCILEGELLVWSDKNGKIMEFNKLRKFISRSGTFIGVDNDSPPQPYEHLMIVFFDILLLDDNVCLRKPHRERRLFLKDAVRAIPGRADIAEQEVLDFSRTHSQYRLERAFSKRITERWEGYVLKGCEDPYFSMFASEANASQGRWIKLKKDYIPGLGDTVDLAIIGARYDSREAVAIGGVTKLAWTHFYIGCLVNKDAVMQLQTRPKFRVVDAVGRHSMNKQNMQILNQFGEFSRCDPDGGHGFEIESFQASIPQMDVVFKAPFVVEMMGSGFEKPSNARYFTLRFPRLLKIHSDRTFEEAASFSELQSLAEVARSVPTEDLSQEYDQWSKRLKVGDGSSKYIIDRSQSTSYQSFKEGYSQTGSSTRCSGPSQGSTAASEPDELGEDRHQRTDLANLHQSVSEVRTRREDIAIYIDDTAMSRSGSMEPGTNQNCLTENENLSQQKTQESHPPPEPDFEFMEIEPGEIKWQHYSRSKQKAVPASPTKSKDAQRNPRSALPSPSSSMCQRPVQSPLTTIPVYIRTESSTTHPRNDLNSTRGLNVITDMDQFLQTLDTGTVVDTSTSNRRSQEPSLGLVCIDTQKYPLGRELQRTSKTLATFLQNDPSKVALRGKISFLDHTFLDLSVDASDRRFCLRETWTNIAREYFYACLSWRWSFDVQDQQDAFDRGDSGRGKSRMSIGFDAEELSILGRLASVKPVVYA